MKLKQSLLLWALLLQSACPAVAQVETKPVQVQKYGVGEVEEFNVLKTDKNVRHGSYVRYLPATFTGVAVFEAGSYDHGQREGEWRTFSEEKPWNRISSVGVYHAGKKEGIWTYYHQYATGRPVAAQIVAKGTTPRAGYSVGINDTAAVPQAQGLYAQGNRVGLWTYFDWKGQVLQKIDHFSNQLLYWRPTTGPVLSGALAAANHPLLYAGGIDQLRMEIYSVMGIGFASSFEKNTSAEFIYRIDAAGKLTEVVSADAGGNTRYHKMLLLALTKVPPLWVPQVVEGKPEPAQYRVKVDIEVEKDGNRTRTRTKVEPLGA